MKLSMWILADWLEKYNPQIKIESGNKVLRNVQLFSSKTPDCHSNVYLGRAEDFISNTGNKVVCVHGHDMLTLQTNDIEEVLNDIINAFDYYNEWSENLKELIDNGCSLKDLLDESHKLIQNSIMISDAAYFTIAHNINYGTDAYPLYKNVIEKGIIPLDAIMMFNKDDRFRLPLKNAYITHYSSVQPSRTICRNLFCNMVHMGWLNILEDKEITNGLLQISDTLGDFIELWLNKNIKQDDLLSYQKLLSDALGNNAIMEEKLSLRLPSLGWINSDKKSFFVLQSLEPNRDIYLTLCKHYEKRFPACLCIIFKSYLVLLLNQNMINISDFTTELSRITETSNIYSGKSYVFTDNVHLKEYFTQAEIAIKYGQKKRGCVNKCEDYAVSAAINIIKTDSHTDLRHPAINKLKKYDTQNNTELYRTLKIFLINERNYTNSAKILCIHKNSLIYRVKRIEEIIGVNLDDADTRLHLIFSCYLD